MVHLGELKGEVMIYPEQRGDCYPRSWNRAEFDVQFDIYMDKDASIAATTEGFVRLNLIEKICQVIKRILGGTDLSQKERVEAAWLKFLYYGEAHGWITESHLKRLQGRLSEGLCPFNQTVSALFQERGLSLQDTSEHLRDLREIVVNYHQRHAADLRPGFWTRLFTPPSLSTKELCHFGDAPLQIMESALKEPIPDPYLAFTHLEMAFDLRNDAPEFQEKLAEKLELLEKVYASELNEQPRKRQKLWIQLGHTAFENQLPDLALTHLSRSLQINSKNKNITLQVAKLYLVYNQYSLAKPFLAQLQDAFPQDLDLQIKAGDAYAEFDQFKEAMEAYEAALTCYQNNKDTWTVYKTQMASVYNKMGAIHLNKQLPNATPSQAISFFAHAVRKDSTVPKYDENLCQAYIEQWRASPENFAAVYGEEWLECLERFETSLIQQSKETISEMLLDGSEQSFKADQHQQADAYLKKAMALFDEDADIKTRAMAAIEAQSGQIRLQAKPQFFARLPYDDALKNLERAVSLDPAHYSSCLFELYLTAAEEEKQRNRLFRDTNKIMRYYQKAFQTLHQKGEYLAELLELYIKTKRYDDAIKLYYDIQEQPWSEQLVLSAWGLNALGKKLFEQEDSEAALNCLEKAYKREPENKNDRQDYFEYSLRLAQKNLESIQQSTAEDGNDDIERLLIIAQDLEKCWEVGFDQLERLKPPFQEVLADVYHSLAACFVQRCLLPRPAKQMDKQEVREHQQLHEADVQKALAYYDRALIYQPENATLHFDKGVLLEWMIEYEEAIKEFECAVKYQPHNPFYHRVLAPLYFAVQCDLEKEQRHRELSRKCAPPRFAEDYTVWANALMCPGEKTQIDPHAYGREKGWFSPW